MGKTIKQYSIIFYNKRNRIKISDKISGVAIVKSLDRGKKFKEERYISTDSITTSTTGKEFYVRETCKASMKKRIS